MYIHFIPLSHYNCLSITVENDAPVTGRTWKLTFTTWNFCQSGKNILVFIDKWKILEFLLDEMKNFNTIPWSNEFFSINGHFYGMNWPDVPLNSAKNPGLWRTHSKGGCGRLIFATWNSHPDFSREMWKNLFCTYDQLQVCGLQLVTNNFSW